MSRIIAATATDLEAGAGAAVLATLRVEGEELAGEHAGQRRLLVGTVVHAGRSLAAVNTKESDSQSGNFVVVRSM